MSLRLFTICMFFANKANALQTAAPLKVRGRALGARDVSAASSRANEQDLYEYLEQELGTVPPLRIRTLHRLLRASGQYRLLEAASPLGLGIHPLVVPLAQQEDSNVVGVLQWPKASLSTEPPVVLATPNGMVRPLAASCADFARKLVVSADFEGLDSAPEMIAIESEGLPYEKTYESGSVRNFGRGLDRYLLVRCAPFPDTYLNLCEEHRAKGDAQSALIAVEKACSLFPEFGFLLGRQASMLGGEAGYELEARDAARTALERPLWSFESFEQLRAVAARSEITEGKGLGEYVKAKSPALRATASDAALIDAAAQLMEVAVATTASPTVDWDGLRDELSGLYSRAGLRGVARLVKGC